MNWVLAAALMFISSVILYLFVRKSAMLHTPSTLNNMATFLVPAILFVPIVLIEHIDLNVTLEQLLIIIFAAIFLSYLGSAFSMLSIERAPNPGYSLMISKNYVLLTSIAAVFLFNSQLTVRSIIAIGIIIISSALIMLGKTSQTAKTNNRTSWLILAIGAFFCWAFLSLVFKYLAISGLNAVARLFYMFVIVSVIIGLEIKIRKVQLNKISRTQIVLLVLVGIFSAAFNYFAQLGLEAAPNIGYINAINASSIAAVAIFAAIFFKDELTKRKLLGIIGTTIGVILLVL